MQRAEQRTQEYSRVCFALEKEVGKCDAAIDGKIAIKKIRMFRKTHRNILDMDPGFFGQ